MKTYLNDTLRNLYDYQSQSASTSSQVKRRVQTLEDVLQLWLLLEQGAQRIKDLGFAV